MNRDYYLYVTEKKLAEIENIEHGTDEYLRAYVDYKLTEAEAELIEYIGKVIARTRMNKRLSLPKLMQQTNGLLAPAIVKEHEEGQTDTVYYYIDFYESFFNIKFDDKFGKVIENINPYANLLFEIRTYKIARNNAIEQKVEKLKKEIQLQRMANYRSLLFQPQVRRVVGIIIKNNRLNSNLTMEELSNKDARLYPQIISKFEHGHFASHNVEEYLMLFTSILNINWKSDFDEYLEILKSEYTTETIHQFIDSFISIICI